MGMGWRADGFGFFLLLKQALSDRIMLDKLLLEAVEAHLVGNCLVLALALHGTPQVGGGGARGLGRDHVFWKRENTQVYRREKKP